MTQQIRIPQPIRVRFFAMTRNVPEIPGQLPVKARATVATVSGYSRATLLAVVWLSLELRLPLLEAIATPADRACAA